MTGEARIHDAQRRAAAPEASVWVAASAGSGKTKVLVDRVLRLLLGGTPVERILCLTFTRAAAAEMSNRIKDSLGRWAALDEAELAPEITDLTGAIPGADTLADARSLFAQVLDAPGGVRIMTIHAFCESLLGRFPLEARVAPHFSVMDDRSAAEIMHEARDDLLIRARDDEPLGEALGAVAARVAEQEFVELLTDLAGERGGLKRMTGSVRDRAHLAERLFRTFDVAPDETDSGIVGAACAEGAFAREKLRRATEALSGGTKTDMERGAAIAAWLAAQDTEERSSGFDAYADAYLKKDRYPQKTLMTKKPAAEAPDAPGNLAAEAMRLSAVFQRRRALAVAGASVALLHLADGLIDLYEARKTARAKLDYDDLILLVRALLESDGAVPWVLYKLDGGIDHILIDEAQDTSPDQWSIVRALAEEFFAGEGARDRPRSVFAVGDPKQSIFSFQRAAPEEFRRMREHFARRVTDSKRGWDDVGLDVSYRTTEPVLRAVDAVFARPEAGDGVVEGPLNHIPHRAGQAGRVEIWPPVMPEGREMTEPWAPPLAPSGDKPTEFRLAAALAATIRGWVDSGEMLESRGRPVRPGDVMILVRRRTQFVDDVVEELKRQEVPVAGVDRMVLGEQIAIMDLVALGEFLLLPEDDLTLAAVLKGPLIGLDEDALFTLAHDRGERSLWSELRRRASEHPDFARAADELFELLGTADYAPPFEFFANLLGRRGGRARIVARLGVQANDPLDEFLGLALAFERAHPPSLQGFLHWFAEGGTEIKRDLEHAIRDEVRVMTVHGAKGLEAPIVILADTMQAPTHGQRLLWSEQEDAAADDDDNDVRPLLLWRPRAALAEPVTDALTEAARRRRDQEYRRLLYVAMTRAADRLYICGYGTRRTPPEGCWYNLITNGLAGIAEQDEIEIQAPGAGGWRGTRLVIATDQTAAPDKAGKETVSVAPIGPLPGWARTSAPDEPEIPRAIAPSHADLEEPPTESPMTGAGEAGLKRGNLIHRLLEVLPEIPSEARRDAAMAYLGRPVHGLEPEEQAALAGEVVDLLGDPEFAALFGPGSRAEVPVVGRVGDTVVSGRIDRLVVDGETVRIVDFKANRSPPDSEDRIPVAYLRQLAAYRAVLGEIYPDYSISCGLLWTAGPVLMAVRPALLDGHAP